MSKYNHEKPSSARPHPGLSLPAPPRLGTVPLDPPTFEIPFARKKISDVAMADNNHVRRIEDLRDASDTALPCAVPEIIDPKKRRSEAAAFARSVVESRDYRNSVRLRAANGTLPPAIEAQIWHYAYGQPRDKMERPTEGVRGRAALEGLTNADLATRARQLSSALQMQLDHDAGRCDPSCTLCIPAEVVQ